MQGHGECHCGEGEHKPNAQFLQDNLISSTKERPPQICQDWKVGGSLRLKELRHFNQKPWILIQTKKSTTWV